jgi:protease I
MINKIISIVFIGALILPGQIYSQEKNDKDVELIKKTILSAYQDGLQNEGDLKKIDEGFHPVFRMIAVDKKGEIWEYPIDEWKKATQMKVQDGKLPRPENGKVKIKIPMVDVTGIAAIAKLEFYVGDKLTFIDYMSLYKLDGKWKIVAKIFNTM